jgi:hypothetical protein
MRKVYDVLEFFTTSQLGGVSFDNLIKITGKTAGDVYQILQDNVDLVGPNTPTTNLILLNAQQAKLKLYNRGKAYTITLGHYPNRSTMTFQVQNQAMYETVRPAYYAAPGGAPINLGLYPANVCLFLDDSITEALMATMVDYNQPFTIDDEWEEPDV